MKKILKKFKKLDKKYRMMFYIISVLYLVSIVFISQGLLLLKNIETVLRIIFLIFIQRLFIILATHFFYINTIVPCVDKS